MGATNTVQFRWSIAALIAWTLALGIGALIGDLSPLRGGLAGLAGLGLLAPNLPPRIRFVVAAAFGAIVLVPGHSTPFVWGLLGVAVALRWRDGEPRIVSAALGGGLAMLVFPFLGNTTLGAMGAVGLGGFLVAMGAPPGRIIGLPLGGIALFAAVQGYQLQVAARTLAVDAIAPVAASRGADRLRPVLAARAAQALAGGDHTAAVHVVRAFPSAHILGQKLARDRGVAFAIDAGWRPTEAVEPDLAAEVAWTLHDAGQPREARAVLGDAPELSLHRALLEAEPGSGAPLSHTLPSEVVAGPGRVLSREEILENERIQVFFSIPEGATQVRLEATGQPFLGPPELRIAVSGSELDTVQVPEDLGSWTFETALAPGVHRLLLAFENDHQSDKGDRNVYEVGVWVE